MYIFKEKLNLYDLAPVDAVVPRILVAEPEQYLGSLYVHLLTTHKFQVAQALPEDIFPVLDSFDPQVLIMSSGDHASHDYYVKIINRAVRALPGLSIVTVGYDVSPEALKKFMNSGVSSHINRRLSRPQDVVVVVKSLLQ